jgi:hypothetical protein
LPLVVHIGNSSRKVLVILYFGGYHKDTELDAPISEASPASFTRQVIKHSYMGPDLKISFERLISNFSWPARVSNPQCQDYRSRAFNRLSYSGWHDISITLLLLKYKQAH